MPNQALASGAVSRRMEARCLSAHPPSMFVQAPRIFSPAREIFGLSSRNYKSVAQLQVIYLGIVLQSAEIPSLSEFKAILLMETRIKVRRMFLSPLLRVRSNSMRRI